MKLNEVPKTGPLQGIKVLCHGQTVGGPYGAAFMAEWGATVINMEQTRIPDSARVTDKKRLGRSWDNGHRNEFAIAFSPKDPEGREIFLKLIAWADIFTEGNKGGTYEKWGLSDEVLWEVNPKLVIIHESGFGQTGDPEYVNRGSFDMIGQALGGTMVQNGPAEPENPIAGRWAINDYMTTLFVLDFALAGYLHAQKTGKGDSVDITQFETGWKTQGGIPMRYFQDGELVLRHGYDDGEIAGENVYECSDGEYAFVSLEGAGVLQAAVKLFGLEGRVDLDPATQIVYSSTPEGALLNKAVREFCAAHTAREAIDLLQEAGVAASLPYDTGMALEDSHVQQREVFATWPSFNTGEDVTGVGVSPKFKNEPAQIWRGAPLHGMDNWSLLSEFGYSDEQVAELYEKGAIGGDKRVERPTAG